MRLNKTIDGNWNTFGWIKDLVIALEHKLNFTLAKTKINTNLFYTDFNFNRKNSGGQFCIVFLLIGVCCVQHMTENGDRELPTGHGME